MWSPPRIPHLHQQLKKCGGEWRAASKAQKYRIMQILTSYTYCNLWTIPRKNCTRPYLQKSSEALCRALCREKLYVIYNIYIYIL